MSPCWRCSSKLISALVLSLSFLASYSSAQQESDEVKGAPAEPADAAEVRREIAAVEKLESVVPDRGAALYFLSIAKQHLGETLDALKLLKECLALREGFDPSGDHAFAGMKDTKEFQDLVESVHRDFPVVAQARIAFETREKDVVPEGLAYNPHEKVFYLSSLNLRKIVKIDPESESGRFSDFVAAGVYHLLPVLGIRVDPTDSSIWANSFAERGQAELLHFTASGQLLGRYAPEDSEKHGFNDLVIRKNGEVILTDSLSGQVYRFDRATHAFASLRLYRELSYPNGIALADDDRQLFVADALGVVRCDLQTDASADVNPGPRSTLAGIDGLYWHRGGLLAIQNGIGSPRVAAFRLSSDGLRVTKTTVLENRSPLVALPTTGAIKGNDFYFITNSQIDNLNDDKVLDPTRLERIRIAMVHLPW